MSAIENSKEFVGRKTSSLYGLLKRNSMTQKMRSTFKDRANSLQIQKPEQSDLPLPNVVFKEGYLFKRARTSGANWKRRFFILEDKMFSYSPVFGAPSKAHFEIVEGTTVSRTIEFPNHPFCLEIRPPKGSVDFDRPLYIAADSQDTMNEWEIAFRDCLNKIAGVTVEILPVTARFYEGTLFKTPRVANKWEAKHFELENGVMYYVDAKKGERNLTFKPERKQIKLYGAQIYPNKTDAKGVPFNGIPFQIKEAGSSRLFNLAAPNEEEYLRWLKSIQAWMKMLDRERAL